MLCLDRLRTNILIKRHWKKREAVFCTHLERLVGTKQLPEAL